MDILVGDILYRASGALFKLGRIVAHYRAPLLLSDLPLPHFKIFYTHWMGAFKMASTRFLLRTSHLEGTSRNFDHWVVKNERRGKWEVSNSING
jgi:hypothetical protein